MKKWKWHQQWVSCRRDPVHRADVVAASDRWLEQEPDGPLRQKVKDILHWDYDYKPYTLDELLKMPEDLPPVEIMSALIKCGYTEEEALMRSTICEQRRLAPDAQREGMRYRQTSSRLSSRDKRKRRQEFYLDPYKVRGAYAPVQYKGIGTE
jgi:hypothetical protein